MKQTTARIKRRLSQIRNRNRSKELVPGTDWRKLLGSEWLEWESIRDAAKGGPKILIATSVGNHDGVTPVESMLGVALTLRGAEVHYLFCDRSLPACMAATIGNGANHQGFVAQGPSHYLCDRCVSMRDHIFAPLGLPMHTYSELIAPANQSQPAALSQNVPFDKIPSFEWEGLAVGEHAVAGALRYFARGTLDGEPDAEPVLRRYFEAALLTMFATTELLNKFPFDVACFNHGIYIPQGVIGEVARQKNLRVVNWNPAYRKHCFIFSHDDTYHHTLMNETTAVWEDMVWTPALEGEVIGYLKSRWYGTRDWIWFHENPEEDLALISAEVGVDFNRPTVGLLTNVIWDAQLHYPANAFRNMLSWVLQTIEYFRARPDLQLVIRVHPAEIRGTIPSRQKIADEIAAVYPILPPNVFVVPPESNVSTYAVALKCDSVIIYGTKTGVELTSFGIPVIVAGEAWIRNKGVTQDAHSVEEYIAFLDQLPHGRRMDEATTTRARMYAYHFFFRRMIPLPMLHPLPSWPPYHVVIESLQDLGAGASPGLDIVCKGILGEGDFVYPAESMVMRPEPV